MFNVFLSLKLAYFLLRKISSIEKTVMSYYPLWHYYVTKARHVTTYLTLAAFSNTRICIKENSNIFVSF